MARVRLEQVTKQYRNVTALDALDLEIEDGQFVSVLGPSGSGKSTMLKLIAGIDEVTSGRILFDKDDITHRPPERRDVAMVFQSYALYPTMNIFDNIAFPLRVRGAPRREIRARVEEAAELLRIGHLLKRRPRELSGGERQRVAIGRCIVRSPRVFLFDEPLSNLDAHLRTGMRQELKHLHRVLGTTFIYVTHDQDDALDMSDETAVLAEGRLQQFAPSADLYAVPANRFIASFVGHPPMNLVEGTISREGGQAVFAGQGLRLPLRNVADRTYGPVVLGLRPEVVKVAPASGVGPSGVVEALSALGYQRLYATVRVGELAIMARAPEDISPPEVGATTGLELDASSVHFFDATSGRRLSGEKPPVVGKEAGARAGMRS